MFSGTLNTMSAIILTKLQSWGQKFDFRLRYQISIALDSHFKVSSLFFIAILSLYSVQFFSLELLDAPHISSLNQNSSLFFFFNFSSAPSGSSSFHPALICPLQSLSPLPSLKRFYINSPAHTYLFSSPGQLLSHSSSDFSTQLLKFLLLSLSIDIKCD